jgi:hypothetical protein
LLNRHGWAWRGEAWLGTARLGKAGQGGARLGRAGQGRAWQGIYLGESLRGECDFSIGGSNAT